MGHCLLELVLALGLATVLAAVAVTGPVPGNPALTAVQGELRAAVEQAVLLARRRDAPVRLALAAGPAGGSDLPPLVLPRGVRWGMPEAGVPLPPGMAAPIRAHRSGAGHDRIVIHPGGGAEANAWFLTDGRDAACLRLSDRGAITLWRWRRRSGRWEPA